MNPLPGIIRYDRKDRIVGQVVHVYQHHTGFTIDLITKPGFQSKYAGFLCPFGAFHTRFLDLNNQQPVSMPLGAAHFLEHCIFSGRDQQGVQSELMKLGVDTDAYTTYSHSLYSFTCVDQFPEALELCFKEIFQPEITARKVKEEADVVRTEYNMYQEDIGNLAMRQLMRGLYNTPQVVEDVLGTPESIDRITAEDLRVLHRNFYAPSTMSLTLVGNFDEEELISRIASWLDTYAPASKNATEVLPIDRLGLGVKSHFQTLDLPSNTSGFLLAYRHPSIVNQSSRSGRDILCAQMGGELLAESMIGHGSPVFESLFAKGIVDESLSVSYNLEAEYGYLLISGDSMQPEKAVKVLQDQLETMVAERYYDETRMAAQIRSGLGNFLRSLDDVESCGEQVIRTRINHLDFTDYALFYSQLEKNKMLDELKFVRPENRSCLIIHGARKGTSI